MARRHSSGDVECAAARELLTTHAHGWMPARSKSALQAGGFEAWRGFGEGDQHDLGLVGVLQPHQRGGEVRVLAHLAGDLPVVGAGGVEQQQGMAGGGGIDDDEVPAGFVDDAEKAWKTATSSVHGDLKSSARFARPWSSRAAPLLDRTRSRYAAVASAGSMCETVRLSRVPAGVSVRCAAAARTISCALGPVLRRLHDHR
ncbi:hypothetical protein QR64_23670 [Rhodococcus sp. Chr-9]|nr:hypothetical protein QR64_23670 [Rhodococcus sp. Chr-9]